MSFSIGDKVMCVDDRRTKPEHAFVVQWPKKGKEYTIRDVFYNDDIVTGVLVKELKNKILFIKLLNREQEQAFAAWRFEKLKSVPPKTSFKKIAAETDTHKVKDYILK